MYITVSLPRFTWDSKSRPISMLKLYKATKSGFGFCVDFVYSCVFWFVDVYLVLCY